MSGDFRFGGVDPSHVCPDCGEQGHIGDDCDRAHRESRRRASEKRRTEAKREKGRAGDV